MESANYPPIQITINGTEHNLTVDPNTPLLWVLRDHLNLMGTKFGCGMAQCGACTVIINGNATRSCVMPIVALSDAEITTIEGIPAEHPVKVSWIEQEVPQCGYCQSGQMVQAFDLLSKNSSPTLDEIKDTMSGNICRCGTYQRINKAIVNASKLLQNNLAYDATAVKSDNMSEVQS